MEERPNLKDVPTLLSTVVRQFAQLMQDEMTLAKAEVSRNLSRAAVGIALIGIAALVLLVALNVLAGALVGYIAASGISAGTAALIVAGGLIVVALVLALIGKSRLSAKALEPTRTAENVKRDIEALKGATHA